MDNCFYFSELLTRIQKNTSKILLTPVRNPAPVSSRIPIRLTRGISDFSVSVIMKKALLVSLMGLLACGTMFAQRLPGGASPENYSLTVNVNFPTNSFDGDETIKVKLDQATNTITLNALEIDFHEVTITAGGQTQTAEGLHRREDRDGDVHRRQAASRRAKPRCTSSTPAS